MNETLPWYKSQVIIGALLSLTCKALVVSGVISEISHEDQIQAANLIVLVLSGLGDLWAMRARVVQTSAPTITMRR